MATSLRTAMGALALALMVAAPAWAQQQRQQAQQAQDPQQRQLQQRTARVTQGEAGGLSDQQIATWLIIANDVEVQLSQFASQRAQNPQVKQFAQMMIQEHGQLSKQLRQFAPNAPHIGREAGQQRTGARDEQEQPGQRSQQQQQQQQRQVPQQQTGAQQPGQARQAGDHHGQDFLQVADKIAERSLRSIEQELARKEGHEFDKAYMSMQVIQHLGLVNATEVLQQHASPQLREILDKAQQSAQQHLQQARQIAQELDAEGGRSQQQRTRQE